MTGASTTISKVVLWHSQHYCAIDNCFGCQFDNNNLTLIVSNIKGLLTMQVIVDSHVHVPKCLYTFLHSLLRILAPKPTRIHQYISYVRKKNTQLKNSTHMHKISSISHHLSVKLDYNVSIIYEIVLFFTRNFEVLNICGYSHIKQWDQLYTQSKPRKI